MGRIRYEQIQILVEHKYHYYLQGRIRYGLNNIWVQSQIWRELHVYAYMGIIRCGKNEIWLELDMRYGKNYIWA